MLIIGENIHIISPRVKEAIEAGDKAGSSRSWRAARSRPAPASST